MNKIVSFVIKCITHQTDNQTAAISGMVTCNVYGLFLFGDVVNVELASLGFKVVGAILCSGLGALTGLLVKHWFDKNFKK